MKFYSQRNLPLAMALIVVIIVIILCRGGPRFRVPVFLKTHGTNRLIRLPPNTTYSKLNLTYDRIVLPESNCSDVFISVRTSAPFHESRLLLLLHTWLQTVDPKQVDYSVHMIHLEVTRSDSCSPGPDCY